MLFKEIVDGRTHGRTTDAGRRTLKDHKSSLSQKYRRHIADNNSAALTKTPHVGCVAWDYNIFREMSQHLKQNLDSISLYMYYQ